MISIIDEGKVLDSKFYSIYACEASHSITAFSYRFEEKVIEHQQMMQLMIILSMVIQRTVFEADAKKGIEDENMEFIKESLGKLEELSIFDMLNELTEQELKLKARTSNGSELSYITRRFDALRTILNERDQASEESTLQEIYQSMRKAKLDQ